MQMALRSRRAWPMLACVAVMPGLLGCTGAASYRVKTSQPWPDEWVSGARVPYERIVQLTAKTVEWHRKANWRALEAEASGLLAGRRDLYGFVRSGVARPLSGMDPSKGGRYLEVKVAPCFFDFDGPPPRITLDYQDKALHGVMSDLMKRVGRSYLISPALSGRPTITAHLVDLDWREAAVRVMLEADVFVEPVWFNPVSLRSYEYASQAEFIAAVRQAIDHMKNPSPRAPLTVVPWETWVLNNRAYQLRYHAWLRSAPTTRPLGPPPGTAILSADLAIAKKQILYALPHQLNWPSTQPAPSPSAGRP